MGNPTGFLNIERELPSTRSPRERVNDYKEFYLDFQKEKTTAQASRCMDCGVPFCHSGCPLGNIIPEFNDAVYREEWEEAIQILSETNNFPEFTGRICPAPCEASCVLGINQPPVAIEHIEKTIAETAFEKGYIQPRPPKKRTGKKVAIIGSGPAGLAAAAQLNYAGHEVVVYEKNDRVGGLLRYGIPDFKLEKWVVDRRVEIMEKEGVKFVTNAYVGKNVDANKLIEENDAVVLCTGSTIPRDLKIPGRELNGVYFAMDFLEKNNRKVAGNSPEKVDLISAKNKHVVVIGGGDTGSDCVGTSNRHGATSITQIELLTKPPASRHENTPWPMWPMVLRTSSSHEEGCDRQWAQLVKSFIDDGNGNVKSIEIVDIEWGKGENGKNTFKEIPGTLREIPCDLALLAIGFLHTEHKGLIEKLGIKIDARGNVEDDNYKTNIDKIFSAGDMRRGQSLVVWAIAEGREVAEKVNEYLMV